MFSAIAVVRNTKILSRKVAAFSTTTANPSPLQLYQYAICPFCNRVKALLDYMDIPYTAVEVNPLTKGEIKWSKDYKKVPIATLEEHQQEKLVWNGSDVIVKELLERKYEDFRQTHNHNLTLQEFAHSESAEKWTQFATDELAALLYPNMCSSYKDSYTAFGYVDGVETFSPLQKIAIKSVGSFAMYMAASRVKKKRNIVDERDALDEALSFLEHKGLAQQTFVSGTDEPNLGDLQLFGTLRSLEGLPVHAQVVHTGPILEWYDRMTVLVDKSSP